MSKVLLKINDEKELMYPADGYILGIDKFSCLFGKTFDIKAIKEIRKKSNNEIYVSFNKMIFNDELNDYKEALHEVDKLNLNGIIVGDIAALTYDLKTNVILDQLHLNNSYYTINHYVNNGLKGIMLTNDITLEEINTIHDSSKALLFKQVFGYPHLSTSKRSLVTNYLEQFNVNAKSNLYEICENKSDDYYKVIEDDFGTHILGDKPLNLLRYCKDLKTDYLIVDGFLIGDVKCVLDAFLNKDIKSADEIDEKYNANDGFINKGTIYKVKNDER